MRNIFTLIFIALLLTQCTKKVADTMVETKQPVEAFRSKAPSGGPARNVELGEYSSFDLANGLKVIVVENHKLPRVSYQISLLNDAIKEGDKMGYISIAGDLISRGTKTKSKQDIDDAVDFIGADLSSSSFGVFGSSLKKHSGALLAMMSDVLLNPSFPKEEFDKIRKQTLSNLASSKTDANTMSANISGVVNFGSNHAFGEVVTEKSVKNFEVEDCKQYYMDYFKPNNAYLIIVGDITANEAKMEAEKYFSSWKAGKVPTETQPEVSGPKGRRVIIGNKEGAVQSVINLTYPVDFKPGAPNAAAVTVMNSILGGGVFSGRLMQNLREDKAYTYGARSNLNNSPVKATFEANASVRNEVTDSSVAQFIYELERMLSEPPTPEMLQLVKNSLSGSFARSLEGPQTIATFARNIYKYNLPKDYYETYLSRLEAVGMADVAKAAQTYIKPNDVNIVVVGNKDAIAEKLLPFDSDGEIEYYDAFGMKLEMNKASLPDGVTGSSIINDYLEAIGGKEKIKTVKSIQSTGTMDLMGQTATVSVKQAEPDKMSLVMSLNGMAMMEQKINGDKGVFGQMGQKQANAKGDPTYDAVVDKIMIFEQLHYADKGYTTEVKELEEVNGENCYKVVVTKAAGKTETHFYSVKSNLLIRTVSIEDQGGQTATVVTDYKDYKEVDGILFPFNTVINGAAPFELNTVIKEVKVNPVFSATDFSLE